jgi:hypothetical protein
LSGRGVAGRNSAEGDTGRRFRRVFYLVLVAILVGLAITYWSWVDAQAQAVVVISSVLDALVLTPVVDAASGDPRFTDVRVAEDPALVARPAGAGP